MLLVAALDVLAVVVAFDSVAAFVAGGWLVDAVVVGAATLCCAAELLH